jgi:hypothetical protein
MIIPYLSQSLVIGKSVKILFIGKSGQLQIWNSPSGTGTEAICSNGLTLQGGAHLYPHLFFTSPTSNKSTYYVFKRGGKYIIYNMK